MSQLTKFLQDNPTVNGILQTVAPILGTAVGGPFGAAAATALVGGLGAAGPKEAVALLAGASPETLLKLKQIETEFKEKMASLGVEEDQLAAQDRDSARQREIKTGDVWTTRILAALVMGGVTMVAFYILFHGVSDTITQFESGLIGTVVGYLFAEAKSVLAYYFGSSQGSRDKDAIIARGTP